MYAVSVAVAALAADPNPPEAWSAGETHPWRRAGRHYGLRPRPADPNAPRLPLIRSNAWLMSAGATIPAITR
jgi:hypothetical protein